MRIENTPDRPHGNEARNESTSQSRRVRDTVADDAASTEEERKPCELEEVHCRGTVPGFKAMDASLHSGELAEHGLLF